ncbi:MAG TPA: DnaJ domain-containing protein [Blastocatellia bacterium]|nr:DnaJ domain-containing protein [Blastocatellia bacterium]
MDDLYKRLGVTSKATPKEIRSAYRRLARDNHPDVSSSPDSAAEFARISDAYKILSDPEKRATYDRGETVTAQPFAFYSAQRKQAVAYQRKIDEIVDEIIESDRQETRTRGRVVTVLVTLFISTFVFALVKPVRFNPFDWPVAVVALGLSLLGIWRLVSVIRGALEHYTYQPPTPSVTHPTDPPRQPFTRSMALAFLAIGYLGSLAAGVLLDEASGGMFSGGGFPKDAMVGALLYPPILVMVIDALRRVGEIMDPR